MNGSHARFVRVPVASTALFLIDVINDLDFEGSDGLVAQAEPMAVKLAALKRRAAAAGVPCLTGIAGNICVLFTANDAYMRELKIFAPPDCIVSNTPEDNEHALKQIETVLKGALTPSTFLRFQKPVRRKAFQSR